MLHGFSIIALSLFCALALASPALEPRQIVDTTVHCGQWDTVTVGPYSLLLDLWGESGATSGSQCAHIVSLSSSTIAWVTNWTWTGGTGVKSFSNIQLNQNIGKQLSAISSIPVSFFKMHYYYLNHKHVSACISQLGSGHTLYPTLPWQMSHTTCLQRTPRRGITSMKL